MLIKMCAGSERVNRKTKGEYYLMCVFFKYVVLP